MGQYYKAILLDKNTKEKIIGWVSSYQYKNGAKLMEHSWIKNTFVKSVENIFSYLFISPLFMVNAQKTNMRAALYIYIYNVVVKKSYRKNFTIFLLGVLEGLESVTLQAWFFF